MGYTVDEVSEVLEIPRPTLYRYLREYSIPHERRAGKISIPEESLERIREARELHEEGLGTASVRKRMRKIAPSLDAGGLAERLDRLCGTLEGLRQDLRLADGTSSSRELREVLEGQRSLALAVHRLSERVEDALATNGRSGGSSYSTEPEEHARGRRTLLDQPRVAEAGHDAPDSEAPLTLGEYPVARARSKQRFGDMSRRRRSRGALALLFTLVLGGVLVLGLARWDFGEEEEQASSIEQASSSEQVSSGGADQEEPPATAETSEAIKVPNLVGLTLPRAREQLVQAGLEPGERAEMESEATPAGMVIAQYPAVGEEAKPGGRVNLLLSSGPPATYQPDVRADEPIPPPEVPGDVAGEGAVALPGRDEGVAQEPS